MQFTTILIFLCFSLWWLSEAALVLHTLFYLANANIMWCGVLFLCYDCLRQHSGKILCTGILISLASQYAIYSNLTLFFILVTVWGSTETAHSVLPFHCKYHGMLFLFLCYDCLRQHSGKIIAFGIYMYLDFICKSVYNLQYLYVVLNSSDCLRQHWYCNLFYLADIMLLYPVYHLWLYEAG
jgi:hypothetical protein